MTVLWNYKLHLPPGHIGLLVSRVQRQPWPKYYYNKISEPSGISFWFMPLGAARLIAKGEESFKWIMQEGENM